MSNVVDNETGRPLGDGKITHVMDWHNKRIGLVGLVEREWLDTLATIDPEEVTFIDFVQAGRSLGKQLKEDGCDYVIALTHMRMPNDIKLAENVDEIDLILGGHDHNYDVQVINGRHIIKSGTDFRELSKVTVNLDEPNNPVDVKRIEITKEIEEDTVMKEIVDSYSGLWLIWSHHYYYNHSFHIYYKLKFYKQCIFSIIHSIIIFSIINHCRFNWVMNL